MYRRVGYMVSFIANITDIYVFYVRPFLFHLLIVKPIKPHSRRFSVTREAATMRFRVLYFWLFGIEPATSYEVTLVYHTTIIVKLHLSTQSISEATYKFRPVVCSFDDGVGAWS